MSGVVTGILGAVLGAAGSVGGGLIQSNQAQGASDAARRDTRDSRSQIVGEVNPLSNPLIANIIAQRLAGLGVVDPSLVQGAGPLGQVLEAVRASGFTGFEQSGIFDTLTRMVSAAGEDPLTPANWAEVAQQVSEDSKDQHNLTLLNQFIPAHLRVGNFQENLAALLRTEHEFQQNIRPVLQNLSSIRDSGLQRTGIINDALLGLTQQVAAGSDLMGLRSAERQRLQREIEDRREQALQRANAGGFNPGGDLEDLQELETDADLVALQRALGLVTGTQQAQSNSLNLLTGLDPVTAASSMNLASLFPSVAGMIPAATVGGGGSGALGQGVAQAGNILNQGLSDFSDRRQNQQLLDAIIGGLAPGAGD